MLLHTMYNVYTFYYFVNINEVVIRTNGDQIVLNVYAPNKDVQFYGFAKEVNVLAAAPNSLHVHGSINTLSVEKGHVQVEETGIVFNLAEVATEGASVTNNGYIAENESGATVEGNQPSDVYQIATLGQLESFRDAVNAGNDFADLTVKLTKDITLRDGWKPIGEGSRNIVDAGSQLKGNFFKGTFDGQNHIISNLTNKGFIPTQSRYDTDGTYAYGLFALVGSSSVIKNVTLKDVNINLEKGDSVAAFVGFCSGSTTLQYLTVENGSIKGVDGIGGILGRTYASENRGEAVTFTVKLENCKNNAAIEATRAAGGKAAGIVGMVGDISKAPYQGKIDLTIKTCVNTGAVKVSNEASSQAAGILGYVTNTRSFTDNQKTDSMYKFYNDCTNSGELDAGEHGLTFDLYDNNPASHVKVIPANN